MLKFCDVCFVCGYSLRGHGGAFKCPECGVAYDAETKFWQPVFVVRDPERATMRYALLFGLAIPVCVLLVGLTIAALGFGAVRGRLLPVLLVGGAGALVFKLWRISRPRRPFLGLTPEGLVWSETGRPGDFKTLRSDNVLRRAEGPGLGTPLSRILEDIGMVVSKDDAAELNERLAQRLVEWQSRADQRDTRE